MAAKILPNFFIDTGAANIKTWNRRKPSPLLRATNTRDIFRALQARAKEPVNESQSRVIPLLASPQGGVAERSMKYREASADREAGVVVRWRQKENHPGGVRFGGCAKFHLMTQPRLLAGMQGGELRALLQ